ncbi:MAG: hypothetical protein HYY49_07740 [Ignavibacteriales bacterium]|nr:hypothetical protein [Ignavibacteriales bacterium]
MNQQLLDFFTKHYAPGRVALVGATDDMYMLIRAGQSSITADKKPSKYNHVFLLGEQRAGTIYILESDIHFSFKEIQFINGPQESKLEKWCMDTVEYAAVLGMDLTPDQQKEVLSKGLEISYDDRYKYPVGELVGTLWAMITKTLHKKNIFDKEFAIQCATFVRTCYQSVDKDMITSNTHPSNTSPEEIAQSGMFTFKQEWRRT